MICEHGGERKSRQRARAMGWKRSRDRDEGKKKGERVGGAWKNKRQGGWREKQKDDTDRLRLQPLHVR